MVKPLAFKGDKKVKKRKHRHKETSKARHMVEVTAPSEDVEDDIWVSAETQSDVSGPIMFVLPGGVCTIACDASGKVFTLPIENIVDGNPASAEPHDVRQVWLANKIVGTDQFRFKGHHGKYLGCDQYGLLSATSVAVSPLESFILTEVEGQDEAFYIKSSQNTYLAIHNPASFKPSSATEVRGDTLEPGFNSVVHIRMQARFKPRIKASKAEKAREIISQRDLEDAVGRRLEDDEVRMLKKARREGDFHEKLLDIKVKHKHDKYT